MKQFKATIFMVFVFYLLFLSGCTKNNDINVIPYSDGINDCVEYIKYNRYSSLDSYEDYEKCKGVIRYIIIK